MTPDVVRTADLRLLPDGAPAQVLGAAAIAEETRVFVDRVHTAVTVLLDGRPGAVIAPGGHAYAIIRFGVTRELVAEVQIVRYRPGGFALALAG